MKRPYYEGDCGCGCGGEPNIRHMVLFPAFAVNPFKEAENLTQARADYLNAEFPLSCGCLRAPLSQGGIISPIGKLCQGHERNKQEYLADLQGLARLEKIRNNSTYYKDLNAKIRRWLNQA